MLLGTEIPPLNRVESPDEYGLKVVVYKMKSLQISQVLGYDLRTGHITQPP